ncbi:MAG: LysR family transcriptional regulator [Prosthecobacter sp.]|nr:LysR family transcriptional regulator [Prosthecobacter sp.]
MAKSTRHYYKEIRLRQMRALIEISRHGSFAQAARELGLSSPAVWQQIRALEREFDADLVKTRGGEATLTDEGELLARLTAPLVESFDAIRAVFAERRGRLNRSLTLATTTALLTHELPPAITRYRKTHPSVTLTLIDRPSLEARAIFEHGGADIAIIGSTGAEDASPQYRIETLAVYHFHLLCPKDHPLLGRKRLTLNDIARHPLILAGPGAAISRHVPGVFAHNDARPPRVALTSTNLALTISYVQMGFGIAIVPLSLAIAAHWQPAQHGQVTIRSVSKLFGQEQIVMLHRANGHELQHVRQFREIVTKSMNA